MAFFSEINTAIVSIKTSLQQKCLITEKILRFKLKRVGCVQIEKICGFLIYTYLRGVQKPHAANFVTLWAFVNQEDVLHLSPNSTPLLKFLPIFYQRVAS
jgi:hypothetical protein